MSTDIGSTQSTEVMDVCWSLSKSRDLLSLIQSSSKVKKKRLLLRDAQQSICGVSQRAGSISIFDTTKPLYHSDSPNENEKQGVSLESVCPDENPGTHGGFFSSECSPPTPVRPPCPNTSQTHNSPLSESPYNVQRNIDAPQNSQSSTDEEFELFLSKLRKPPPSRPVNSHSPSFITEDSDSSSEDEPGPLFYYQVDNSQKSTHPINFTHTEQNNRSVHPSYSPRVHHRQRASTLPRPQTHAARSISPTDPPERPPIVLDFVYSLFPVNSNTGNKSHKRHPSAERFVKHFKANRVELAHRLFRIFNERIFDKQLPEDLEIKWNSRLLKTAGQCKYLRREYVPVNGERTITRLAQIELSPKVCTTAERVRDTLLHEACHAVVWIVDGINDGHGPRWRSWAARALRVWPKLPLVSVCHAYHIETRFTYRCTGCGACLNRHSKSLDTKKQVCGHCHSTFELLLNTPRGRLMRPSLAGSMDKRLLAHSTRNNSERRQSPTPSSSASSKLPFSEFVRNNYKHVRNRPDVKTHADAMATLSSLFKSMRLTASSCDLSSHET